MSIGVVLFGGIFFLLSIGVIYGGYQSRSKAFRAMRWPKIDAEIEEAGYHRESSNGTYAGRKYCYDLKYSYTFDDKDYEGSEFSPIKGFRKSEDEIKDDLAPYTEGQKVKIRVNPNNPVDSYLEVPSPEEAKSQGRKSFVIGGVLVLVSLFIIAYGVGIGRLWAFALQLANMAGIV